MQVTETNREGLRREFKVVLAADDIDLKVSGRLAELAGQARIPGFRPGKVPVSLLKQRVGRSVLGEVLQQAVQDSASQALGEKGLRPAMPPQIDIGAYKEGKDLEYTVAVEVMPEIAPMDFKTLKLERRVIPIDDSDVDRALKRMAAEQKRTEKVEEPRAAESGETVVIDFVGKIDGKVFDGGTGEGFSLELGGHAFIPGFEEQLVGAKAGDERQVTVAFPDDYPKAELAGKEAVFDVTLKELRAPIETAIDEEFAKQMGLDDLESLRTEIRRRIEGEFGQLSRQRLKRELLDSLSENHSFEIPDGMKKAEFDQIWSQLQEASERGDEEDRVNEADGANKDEDALRAEYREIAERRVRLGLLLSEVGRINNISISGEDLNRAIMQEARKHPGHERQVFDFYRKNERALNGLRAPIFEEKVVDFILELADVADIEATLDELMDMPDDDVPNEAERNARDKLDGGGAPKAEKTGANEPGAGSA